MLAMLSNWRTFQHERFPLRSHLLMIWALHWAHSTSINHFLRPSLRNEAFGFEIALFFVLLSFFFRMRLFDEIKDYAVDCEKNPSRPLPRGVLKVSDLHRAIIMLFIFEIVLTSIFSPYALAILLPAQCYSLLMYKEFFIGKVLRRHLTTYAVTHTAVMILLSAFCSAWLLRFPWRLELCNWVFAAGCFGVFNVFEFGRKTYAEAEEQPGVDSYSKIWGRGGAVLLNLSQGLFGLLAMGYAFPYDMRQWIVGGGTLAVLFIIGMIYVFLNTAKAAKVYRAASGAAILLLLWASILH